MVLGGEADGDAKPFGKGAGGRTRDHTAALQPANTRAPSPTRTITKFAARDVFESHLRKRTVEEVQPLLVVDRGCQMIRILQCCQRPGLGQGVDVEVAGGCARVRQSTRLRHAVPSRSPARPKIWKRSASR